MKSFFSTLSLAALCLGAFSALSQAKTAPAGKNVLAKKPPQVHLYTEFIEISSLEFAGLMSATSNDSDHTTMRNKLLKQVKDGKATLVASNSIICRSGERCTSESIREYIYPTEYQPPSLPGNGLPGWNKTKPSVVDFPPLATAFETRNLGLTVEIEPIIGEDRKTIELTFKPELIKHVGDEVFLDWNTPKVASKSKMPTFYTLRINTSLTISDGQFVLASALTPELDGKPDHTKKVLVFVKATVLKLGK
ncbi:MAG: hypothetical protein ACI9E1_000961 [Cryomorphaceae bacterium]|jgi:hypothetical protein